MVWSSKVELNGAIISPVLPKDIKHKILRLTFMGCLVSSFFVLAVFSSVQVSRSVLSDSLRPHELQHARPPCPSPHVHRVGDAIQPSHPLSSPSPPALNLSQHQGLFK